jgi:hypothetical protein
MGVVHDVFAQRTIPRAAVHRRIGTKGLGGPEGTTAFVVVLSARNRALGGWDSMKNTGKRIFFAGVVFALSNLALVAAAGLFTSQR